jgi:hypothetical protein
MRLDLPDFGFLPMAEAAQQHENSRNVRMFLGSGGPFIAVPGLLQLKQVAMPGLVFDTKIERSVPLDPTFTRMLEFVTDCARVIHAPDGTALLERSRWSNDGVWQPNEPVYVVGEWDETQNPAPEHPLPPPEPVHRPVLTSPGAAEGNEVRVGRANKPGV